MSKFNADEALETARKAVHGFGFDLPEDKFALTTENHKLRDRIDELEKERDELKKELSEANDSLDIAYAKGYEEDNMALMKFLYFTIEEQNNRDGTNILAKDILEGWKNVD